MKYTVRYIVARVLGAAVMALVFFACNRAIGQENDRIRSYYVYETLPLEAATQAQLCEGFADAANQKLATESRKNYRNSRLGSFYQNYQGIELYNCAVDYDLLLDDEVTQRTTEYGIRTHTVPACPDGNLPVDGECPSECEVGKTKNIDWRLDLKQPDGGEYVTDQPPSKTSFDGCEYTLDDVGVCVVGSEGGEPDAADDLVGSCSYSYSSTGNDLDGTPPPDNPVPGGAPQVQIQTVEHQATEAQTSEELADGTTKVIDVSTMQTTGGGRGEVTGNGNTISIVKNSSNQTTTVTTTTYPPEGGSKIVKQVTNHWENGDVYNIQAASDGLGGAVTKGASGGGEQTTTTETNPDGSSTTTTVGSGGSGATGGQGGAGGGDSGGDGGSGEGEGQGDSGQGPKCENGSCDSPEEEDEDGLEEPDVNPDSPNLPMTLIELPDISVQGQQLNSACPSPISISVLDQPIEIEMQPLCDMAGIMAKFIVAGAWLLAAVIVGRSIG